MFIPLFVYVVILLLLDESPETCSIFLREGGLELFLQVLEAFPGESTVETKVIFKKYFTNFFLHFAIIVLICFLFTDSWIDKQYCGSQDLTSPISLRSIPRGFAKIVAFKTDRCSVFCSGHCCTPGIWWYRTLDITHSS